MARNLIPASQAFEQLRTASQNLNRKLRDLAAEVEQTGELPAPHHEGGRPKAPSRERPGGARTGEHHPTAGEGR